MSEFIIDKEILVKQQEFIKDCEEKIHLKNMYDIFEGIPIA